MLARDDADRNRYPRSWKVVQVRNGAKASEWLRQLKMDKMGVVCLASAKSKSEKSKLEESGKRLCKQDKQKALTDG